MATPRGLPTRESLGCQGHCWDAAGRSYQITSESGHTIHRLTFTDFYRFFGLSWETPTINNYHLSSPRIHFPPLRSKGGKSILEKRCRESGKEKGPGHHNTDDDFREFHYYHYMALIRALEESLRDST
jgi:hypothetical protein